MGLSRGVDPLLMAAITAEVFYPVLLVHLDWQGTAVHAHTGRGNIIWDSATWSGVGDFGSVEVPEEAAGMAAIGADVVLVGIPPDILADADAVIRNREGRILIGATTAPAGNVLIGDPVEVFAGYMDAARVEIQSADDVMVLGLRISLGSGPSARAFASVVHSYSDQIKRHPGDTAGRLVALQEQKARVKKWPEA